MRLEPNKQKEGRMIKHIMELLRNSLERHGYKKINMNQTTTSFGVKLEQRQEGETQLIWQVVGD